MLDFGEVMRDTILSLEGDRGLHICGESQLILVRRPRSHWKLKRLLICVVRKRDVQEDI